MVGITINIDIPIIRLTDNTVINYLIILCYSW